MNEFSMLDDDEDNTTDKDDDSEQLEIGWGEFSYRRYEKPTNRWDLEPTDWELFILEEELLQ